MVTHPDYNQVVRHVCEQLAFDFGDEFTAEKIQECVTDSFEVLSHARVQTYIPLLLHRSARARLRADATALEDRSVANSGYQSRRNRPRQIVITTLPRG